jgi:enoyl-[acyl-carrier-protein] reductase (NADH)
MGKGMARALAEAGSDLILIARHEEEIDRTAKEIGRLGKNALAIKTEVTQSEIERGKKTKNSPWPSREVGGGGVSPHLFSVRCLRRSVAGKTIFIDGGMAVSERDDDHFLSLILMMDTNQRV